MGKAEFLGRAIGKPNAILFEEDYKAPSLEWFQIHRGAEDAGELLAAFEMFEVGRIHCACLAYIVQKNFKKKSLEIVKIVKIVQWLDTFVYFLFNFWMKFLEMP